MAAIRRARNVGGIAEGDSMDVEESVREGTSAADIVSQSVRRLVRDELNTSLRGVMAHSQDPEYDAWFAGVELEVMKALEDEEAQILAAYYQSLNSAEDESILHQDVSQETLYVQHLEAMGGDENKVVLCPVCASNFLLQNHGVIFCACGLRVDTKSDAIGLAYTKQALGGVMQAHLATGCPGRLRFNSPQICGTSYLQASCEVCRKQQIVI